MATKVKTQSVTTSQLALATLCTFIIGSSAFIIFPPASSLPESIRPGALRNVSRTTNWLVPTADGTHNQFTPLPLGGTSYQKVDEARCNDNDFLYTDTRGDAQSFYFSLNAVPANAVITKIEVLPCVSLNNDVANRGRYEGAGDMEIIYAIGGHQGSYTRENSGPGVYLMDEIPNTPPQNMRATQIPLPANGIVKNRFLNRFEVGVRLSAEEGYGEHGLRLSRLATRVTYRVAK